MSPLPHQLALEVDRCLKLSLNNKQFNKLAGLIAIQEDGRKFANQLMASSPVEVIDILSKFKSEDGE